MSEETAKPKKTKKVSVDETAQPATQEDIGADIAEQSAESEITLIGESEATDIPVVGAEVDVPITLLSTEPVAEVELTPEQIEKAWASAEPEPVNVTATPDSDGKIEVSVNGEVIDITVAPTTPVAPPVVAPKPEPEPKPERVYPRGWTKEQYEERVRNFLTNNPYASAADVRDSDL